MNQKPFFAKITEKHLLASINGGDCSEMDKNYLFYVSSLLDGRTEVTSAIVQSLNRYAIQPGKIFGKGSKSPDKYKVLRLIVDDVVIQNMSNQKVQVVPINELLKDWAARGIKEISFLEELITTVKNVLGPFLGAFLTGALISWLYDQLHR